jgi:hypothetical protein
MDALIHDRHRGDRSPRTRPFCPPGMRTVRAAIAAAVDASHRAASMQAGPVLLGASVGLPGKALAGAMGFMRRHKVISFAIALVLILGLFKRSETDDGRRRVAGRDNCGS